jgi:N-carbamoylputrescine amidase
MTRPVPPFRLGLVQTLVSADPRENLERTTAQIREAAARGAQIVCLQELFRTHYFCQREDAGLFDLAEPVPGPTTEELGRLAASLKVVIVASVFERRAPGVHHNTAAVLDADGSLAGIYRKMHIPDDPLYYEKFYFAPGDLGFRAIPTRYARIGTLVCWDQWYPEAARLTALAGADLIVYPTAIGWHPGEKDELGDAQYDAWHTMHRAHAIANGVFVAAVNRVGHEGAAQGAPFEQSGGIQFWGGSMVIDPFGSVVARGSHDREEILVVECDPSKTEVARRNWPFFRDRRVDAYEKLTRRWGD